MRGLPTKSAVTPLRIATRPDAISGRVLPHDRPGALRPEGVLHGDGDPARHGGADRRRMEHLRAEERELGRLGIAHLRHEARRGHDARVGRQNAVHVGPDLDAAHGAPDVMERGAEERGRVVRAAAAERRRRAVRSGADEASRHDDPARPRGAARRGGATRDGRLLLVRQRRAVRGVRREDLARVDPHGLRAARAERGGDEARRDQLARRSGAHPRSEERFLRGERSREKARRRAGAPASSASAQRRGLAGRAGRDRRAPRDGGARARSSTAPAAARSLHFRRTLQATKRSVTPPIAETTTRHGSSRARPRRGARRPGSARPIRPRCRRT